MFFYCADDKSDVMGGSTERVQLLVKSISKNIEAVFFKQMYIKKETK